MLWVLVVLSSVELIVVHLLVAMWSHVAAAMLSAVTLAGMGWLIACIRSFRRLPVLIRDGELVMRVGTLRSIRVPLSQVAGLRAQWDAPALKARDVLNMALVAWPNVVVELVDPLPGRRAIRAIAHRLDDPVSFAREMERVGRVRD